MGVPPVPRIIPSQIPKSCVPLICCHSAIKSCLTLSHHSLQHTRLPSPSLSSGVCSSSYPLSQWCYLTTSSSATPFSCPQSFSASGAFPMSQLFTSGGQSIGASASASVLPMNLQGWFPLGLTGLISLLSKGLSRVFSSTTVQKHQFFGTQLSAYFVCLRVTDNSQELSTNKTLLCGFTSLCPLIYTKKVRSGYILTVGL